VRYWEKCGGTAEAGCMGGAWVVICEVGGAGGGGMFAEYEASVFWSTCTSTAFILTMSAMSAYAICGVEVRIARA